jgi:hypothetical protein
MSGEGMIDEGMIDEGMTDEEAHSNSSLLICHPSLVLDLAQDSLDLPRVSLGMDDEDRERIAEIHAEDRGYR